MPGADGSRPFVVRLAQGDITAARATIIVVNHLSGVPPGGAEAAIDAVLGGALSRRAARGALDTHFGGSQFLPTATSPVAASAVLVVGLGEAEKFAADRLGEIGAAVVEAVATFGIRDAATILHGGGSAGVEPERAAKLFMEGVFAALEQVPGADCFRELTLVERARADNRERLAAIRRGIMAAKAPPRVHVYLEEADLGPAGPPPRVVPAGAVPEHLRIGITRAGPDLKVTVIGHGGFDVASGGLYPSDEATLLLKCLQEEVLAEDDGPKRLQALRSIGERLYNTFLAQPEVELAARLEERRDGYVVLRLDRSTVELPWELVHYAQRPLCRTHLLARQLELEAPGRAAALPPAHSALKVLVVGNPTGDLPFAHDEARFVAQTLTSLPGAEVKLLVDDVTYADVSQQLDTVYYDVLHYAGHAVYDPLRPELGGLVLQGATLTAQDLATRVYLPRLVFANACGSAQTGAGPGEPLAALPPTLDLVAGLLRVGVRAFLGSMWPVRDAPAGTFARAFYQALVANDPDDPTVRLPVGKAVRRAREAVVAEHGEDEPAWAAYALYGSPWTPGL